ncbi:MAG: hypothetical protein ACI9JN_001181 [Bacteroidia bacterium]|jgi:hypothetical protein
MIRHVLLIFAAFGFFMGNSCSAQIKDSVRTALGYKPHFVFGINSKISSVSGDPSRTMRLFAGLDYNKKLRFELALNYMPNVAVDNRINDKTDTTITTNQMVYWGLQTEYTFYRKNRWKLSYPVQLGWGVNQYTQRINRDLKENTNKMVVPLEIGANAIYYFYDWVGIKAGMGVRMSFGTSFSTLSGPYYNIGIAFYAGELYKTVKAKLK